MMKTNANPTHQRRNRFIISFLIAGILCVSGSVAYSVSLEVRKTNAVLKQASRIVKPDQLPQSRIAFGKRNIRHAWFSGPTDRYHHGVLGDSLEASQLNAETNDGRTYQLNLPSSRVFEDLEPRLADLDKDGRDEIIVIESDLRRGASMSVYGIRSERLQKITSTPFLGQANRWLNPVGTGDFDGDGQLDIALVATPHIGGILRLYRYHNETLRLFAEMRGISTHRIGSTELGLGRVVKAVPRDLLLVPNQSRKVMVVLSWTPNGIEEVTRTTLSDYLATSLYKIEDRRWAFRLDNGVFYQIQMTP